MSAVDILVRAEELLYEQDWSPNAKRGPEGPRCSFWAIIDASGRDMSASYVACQIFRESIGASVRGYGDIFEWNDAPGRTFGEVMDAFGQAIVLAKERDSADHSRP